MEKFYCFLLSTFGRKKFANVLETFYSSCPEESSEEFFGKCYGFFFFGLSEKFFRGFTENVSTGLSKLVPCVQMIFMGQKSPSDRKEKLYIFCHCWILSETDLLLVGKILTSLSKLHFICSEKHFEDFFTGNLCLFFFWSLIEKCSNFHRKTFERFLKMAFCVSRLTLWVKWFFETFVFFVFLIFGLWSKKLWMV